MISYQVRAFRPDGRFAYGAQFRAEDDSHALRRFHDLPFGPHQAGLYRARRLMAVHPEAPGGFVPPEPATWSERLI